MGRTDGFDEATELSRKLWELKLPNFNSHRLVLHQNGVEFRQQFIGAIRNSLIVS